MVRYDLRCSGFGQRRVAGFVLDDVDYFEAFSEEVFEFVLYGALFVGAAYFVRLFGVLEVEAFVCNGNFYGIGLCYVNLEILVIFLFFL